MRPRLGRFADLLDELARRTNYELRRPPPGGFRLERIRRLAAALGNPQRAYPAVQVAGTCGKGTCAAALASILDAAGLRVGLYTSPHLRDLRERIRVGANPAPDPLWLAAAEAVFAAAEEAVPDDPPTYFELLTATAFEAFRRAEVEVGVFEVGLGGRLDATSALEPVVSIVTRVARDHCELLGPDERAIAGEKAAIIRAGGLALAGPEHPDATDVVQARAAEVGAPLWLLDREVRVRAVSAGPGRQRLEVRTPAETHDLEAPLLARGPTRSLALAIGAAELLRPHLARDPREGLVGGVARLRWRGRFDVIPGDPEVVVDGAHDPVSAAALVESYRSRFGERRAVLVCGIARDKEIGAVLATLAPIAQVLVPCAADSPRAAEPAHLAALAQELGLPPQEGGAVGSALEEAQTRARALRVPVVVAGSLYVAGEALELLGEDTAAAWRATDP